MSIPIWQQIRATLMDDLSTGRYAPGDRLPSEADLATRFGVNRHTVRRALGVMAEEGVVHARRGAGVFVTGGQIAYRLGRRTRFSQNLADAGHVGHREIIRLETLPAARREAEALSIPDGTPVHVLETIASADRVPVSLGLSFVPAERASDFPAHFRDTLSITSALAACGIADYRRQVTRLTAEVATGMRARHLHLREQAPLLRTTALNVTPDDRPIEYGRTWFAADRVELIVDEQSFPGTT